MGHDHDQEEHQKLSIHQETKYLRKIESFLLLGAVKKHLQKLYHTTTKITEKYTQHRHRKHERVDACQNQKSR
eukprot:8683685-Karenia_brevis.AAC.1